MIRIRRKNRERGAALLVVLFVVMAVTILALGFLSRSDVELACGRNMVLRTGMDYLADSGLQHARGLILNPQNISSDEYWTGAAEQQLIAGGSDYYDVAVNKLGPCDYQVSCEGYRKDGAEKIGRSGLTAQLRLDPAIAVWVGSSWTSEARTTVNGDVYCHGNLLTAMGNIRGDAFASGDIAGVNILGSKSEHVYPPPVASPGLGTASFSSSYYIGMNSYSVQTVGAPNLSAGNYYPSVGNPAGIYYCNGDVNMPSGVNINGMLVVKGNLKISGTNNVITAVKNFPALIVGGELIMENGAALTINGLAQIKNRILVRAGAANVRIVISGALVILNGNIDGLMLSSGSTLNVTAEPDKAAIQVWPSPGTAWRWSPAAGAFFRSIVRQ